MSDDIEISAPGKLYLFGEYAVLAGGWAVVAAVDRWVRVRRQAEASGYRVRGADDETELVEAVLEGVESEAGRAWKPASFSSDVTELYESGKKLGLGSSAASAVGLTAAAMVDGADELEDPAVRRRVFEVAEGAHRRFQRGRGSGGGVVASTFGGVVGFRRRTPTEPFLALDDGNSYDDIETTDDFEWMGLSMPPSTQLKAVWLGSQASTRSFIGAVERKLELDPAPVYQAMRRITDVAERALEACRNDDTSRLVETAGEGDEAMEKLGEAVDVSVVTAAHEALRRIADDHGLAAKPSGAGGGEFSVLFGNERTDWKAVEAQLPSDMRMADVSFGAEGVS